MTRPEDKGERVLYLSDYVYQWREDLSKMAALRNTHARRALRHQLLCEKAIQHRKLLTGQPEPDHKWKPSQSIQPGGSPHDDSSA